MTNTARRHMIGLVATTRCTSCSMADETLLHVLRDYQYAEVVWAY